MVNKQTVSGEELLHQRLFSMLCEEIYNGKYSDGSRLPSERELAEQHGLSRVTVRKTLETMEADGLVDRLQGHGTRVRLLRRGYPGSLAIVAVLAPVQNPFFSAFMRAFESKAEGHDCLVVLKQTSPQWPLDRLPLRFFQRGIRNLVVWPYDETLDAALLERARGIGINMVLFDRVVDSPTVDCVSVDNRDAIATLLALLQRAGHRRIAYAGWDTTVLSSNSEREQAFLEAGGDPRTVIRLPWRRETAVETEVAEALKHFQGKDFPDAFLCANGNIGIAISKLLRNAAPGKTAVVSVDDLPQAELLGMTVYAQPMERMAEAVFERLTRQNAHPASWKGTALRFKGGLVEHTA